MNALPPSRLLFPAPLFALALLACNPTFAAQTDSAPDDPAGNDVPVQSRKPPGPKLDEPKISSIPALPPNQFPEKHVTVELCDPGTGTKNLWPPTSPVPMESFQIPAFGLFELPHLYTDTGVRADRPNPLLVRAYARISIPAGRHRFLLRGRGASCLFLDGTPILTTPFPPPGSDNRPVTAQNDFLDLGPDFRFVPPGNRESWVELDCTGGQHEFILETLIGRREGKDGALARRPELGETVAAISLEGSFGWSLIAPENRQIPYTDSGWATYRAQLESDLERLNTAHRARAREESASYWKRRREQARVWLHETPEEPVPNAPGATEIDRFLAAKLASARAQRSSTASVDFHARIQPLLDAKCRDCHQGGKAKGGLRIDRRDSVLKGGKSGDPAIVPGNPNASALLARITSTDPDEKMPPKGDGFTEAETALIRTWIQEGAPWPEFPDVPLEPTPQTTDLQFLRKVFIDTVGVPPSLEEIAVFQNDPAPDKRARLIDRLLADPRAADAWMGYWQDVLAENPNILNPTLNNTGPFRWWIHESLVDRKPADLMVTELLRMKGSERFGGPAGFGVASQNDVPMAAKGTVVAAAFLGVEMKCARCHDAPAHASKQEHLFQLAALLANKPLTVPKTSSVPMDRLHTGSRKPLIEVTLQPGATVPPAWPFAEFVPESVGNALAQDPADQRDRLAALVTAPQNQRFAQVLVNRVWARLMGRGIVEPVSDWEKGVPTHPELLRWLARELVRNEYRLDAVRRLILNSQAYQRQALPSLKTPNPLYSAPAPRRMEAEQVVDSLFAASRKPFKTEEASLDIDSIRTLDQSISLGQPRRAWMLTSTSNERDRPSLALPRIQAVADVLSAFGWRGSRQDPVSVRESAANPLQPAILANGIMGTWLTTLSDDHGVTQLALRNLPLPDLVDAVYLQILTRQPTPEEKAAAVALLTPGFDARICPEKPAPRPTEPRRPTYYVSWSNHLDPDATVVRQKEEKAARRGDPPTERLDAEWRLRMEDLVWSLLNAPEFVFLP